MNSQDYFAKDFDPSKVTIRRLKEILNAHNISYRDISKKAEFVLKFQEHILPIVERQKKIEEKEQKGIAELKQERKTAKDHRVRKSVNDQKHTEEDIIPLQTKTPHQRKKKSGRASSKKQKEETVAQQHEDEGQRLSPPRPLKAPTSPTPFYPMVPPYPRTPTYPFLEPEELEAVRRKDQELQQSSERQETPLHSTKEGSENRTESSEVKINNVERREAFAYCFKPRVSKRNIDRRPPPEFVKRKRGIRLSSRIFFLSLLFIFSFLYLSLKFKIGFCDSVVSSDRRESENLPSIHQLVTNKMCTQCPPKATCSKGAITECEKGFKQETSFFRFTKPHCVIDKDQTTKEKKYTKEFKEIIARETGRVDCGYSNKDNLMDENLKLQLKEKMPPQDYEYINITYANIFKDDKFKIENYNDSNDRFYILSKKPTYSFYCQLTNAFVNLIKTVLDNLLYSLSVVSTLSALLFGILYIRQWIWERGQVSVAYSLALMRLKEHKKIIDLEFREEAFAHVKDPIVRQKLFKKLDEEVRAHPYVRAGNTRYDGFEAGSWEWKAPTSHFPR